MEQPTKDKHIVTPKELKNYGAKRVMKLKDVKC
jgi:hypothetical protein